MNPSRRSVAQNGSATQSSGCGRIGDLRQYACITNFAWRNYAAGSALTFNYECSCENVCVFQNAE